MKRGNLPDFTSASAIPFGNNPNQLSKLTSPAVEIQGAIGEDAKPYDHSIWEVPETPKK